MIVSPQALPAEGVRVETAVAVRDSCIREFKILSQNKVLGSLVHKIKLVIK